MDRRSVLGCVGGACWGALTKLLQDKERPAAEEGGKRRHGGEDRDGVVVPRVKALEHGEDEVAVGDGAAEVVKLVGEVLEPGEVVVHRQGALLELAKLGGDDDRLRFLVVEEDAGDGVPGSDRKWMSFVESLASIPRPTEILCLLLHVLGLFIFLAFS